VAPLANRSNGATTPMLILFANRSVKDDPMSSKSCHRQSLPTTIASRSDEIGLKPSSTELIDWRRRRGLPSCFCLRPSKHHSWRSRCHWPVRAARELQSPKPLDTRHDARPT
jgi:hypothetical protein